jgi:hypothetical protein
MENEEFKPREMTKRELAQMYLPGLSHKAAVDKLDQAQSGVATRAFRHELPEELPLAHTDSGGADCDVSRCPVKP